MESDHCDSAHRVRDRAFITRAGPPRRRAIRWTGEPRLHYPQNMGIDGDRVAGRRGTRGGSG